MNQILASPQMVSLSSSTLVVVAIMFAILHFAFLACIILFKKRLHPMYFLLMVTVTMFYLSPFYNVTGSNVGRWLRFYLVVLTPIVGLVLYRPKRIGFPAIMALVFAVFMTLNAARASDAFVAMTYKGLFLCALISGIVIAHCVQGQAKVFKQLHWLVALMVLYAANFVYYIANSAASGTGGLGRLLYGNLGPLCFAIPFSVILVICAFVMMYDKSTRWKIAAAFVCVVAGTVILLTGSRGPTFASLGACLCMAIPLSKRPVQLIIVLLFIAIGIGIVVSLEVEFPRLMRALGLAENVAGSNVFSNRMEIWKAAIQTFLKYPILGAGYARSGLLAAQTGGAPMGSAYIEILAEGGIVGGLLFFTTVIAMMKCLFTVFKKGAKHPEFNALRCLPVGLCVYAVLLGIGTAEIFRGTSLSALGLGLAVGFTDAIYLAVKSGQAQSRVLIKRRIFNTGMNPSPESG